MVNWSGWIAKAVCAAALCVAFSGVSACRDGKGKVEGLGIEVELRKRTLSNGLVAIVAEDHTVPIVSYQTWYRVGSADETPGKTGMAHLFEHLMFKGTAKYGAGRFFQELEAKGAEVNAFTTRDYTVYYENFVPDLLEKVIDMEADRMANLQLDEGVLATERAVVFEERRMRTDNAPEGRMQETLWSMAFRWHPYQWPVIGKPEDLESITADELKAFYETHYHPANAAIVVVGAVDPDKVFDLIAKHYESLPKRERRSPTLPPEPEQQAERRTVMRDKVASERFAMAYHVTSAHQDDSYALDVLANILFEGTTSRAYQKLVEEKNVAVGVAGSAFTPNHPGLFIISGTMKSGVPSAEAEKLLEELIRDAQERDVSEEEIRVAVRQLTVELVDSVRTPQGLGQLIGTVQTIFQNPERFSEDLAKYTKVTASDVKRVARKYLQPINRSVVTLIPEMAVADAARR